MTFINVFAIFILGDIKYIILKNNNTIVSKRMSGKLAITDNDCVKELCPYLKNYKIISSHDQLISMPHASTATAHNIIVAVDVNSLPISEKTIVFMPMEAAVSHDSIRKPCQNVIRSILDEVPFEILPPAFNNTDVINTKTISGAISLNFVCLTTRRNYHITLAYMKNLPINLHSKLSADISKIWSRYLPVKWMITPRSKPKNAVIVEVHSVNVDDTVYLNDVQDEIVKTLKGHDMYKNYFYDDKMWKDRNAPGSYVLHVSEPEFLDVLPFCPTFTMRVL